MFFIDEIDCFHEKLITSLEKDYSQMLKSIITTSKLGSLQNFRIHFSAYHLTMKNILSTLKYAALLLDFVGSQNIIQLTRKNRRMCWTIHHRGISKFNSNDLSKIGIKALAQSKRDRWAKNSYAHPNTEIQPNTH